MNKTDNRGDMSLPANERVLTQHKYRFVTHTDKASLIITKELQAKIDHLHTEVGEREWSGRLVYKILKGSVTDPVNMVVEAIDLIPMDIGTAGATEFECGDEAVKYYTKYPERLRKVQMGLIHTHHSMGAYFSGVDTATLEELSTTDGIFLSLIVDFQKKPVAKISFLIKQETIKKVVFVSKFIDTVKLDINEDIDKKEEALMIVDMDIEIQETKVKDEYFLSTLAAIEKKKVSKIAYRTSLTPANKFFNDVDTSMESQLELEFGRELGINWDMGLGTKIKNVTNNIPKTVLVNDFVNSQLEEENEAIKDFIYRLCFNDELIFNRKNISYWNHEINTFSQECMYDSIVDYCGPGGVANFSEEEAVMYADETGPNLDYFYSITFYPLGDEYTSIELQADIFRATVSALNTIEGSNLAPKLIKVIEAAIEELTVEVTSKNK